MHDPVPKGLVGLALVDVGEEGLDGVAVDVGRIRLQTQRSAVPELVGKAADELLEEGVDRAYSEALVLLEERAQHEARATLQLRRGAAELRPVLGCHTRAPLAQLMELL